MNQNIEEDFIDENGCDSLCPHCGLSMELHLGDGFCPPGTEEFGGRR